MKVIANPTLEQLFRTTERWFYDKLVTFAELLTDHLVVKAEQSNVTSIQSQCFTAIQSIRTTGSRSIPLFMDSLREQFHTNSIKADTPTELFNIRHNHKNALDLLTTKDLEDSLSYETAIEKLHKNNKEAFEYLEVRIYELLKPTRESIKGNPVSAETIITAFRESLDRFDFTPEIRIEVYQLFEKFMDAELPELLNILNEQLIAAGILPEISPDYFIKKLARHSHSGSTNRPEAEETPNPASTQIPKSNEVSQAPDNTEASPSTREPQVNSSPAYRATDDGSQKNIRTRLMELSKRLSHPDSTHENTVTDTHSQHVSVAPSTQVPVLPTTPPQTNVPVNNILTNHISAGTTSGTSSISESTGTKFQMNSLLDYRGSQSYSSANNNLRKLHEAYIKTRNKGIAGLITSSYSNQYHVSTDELLQAIIHIRNASHNYQQQEGSNRSIAQKIRAQVLAGINKSEKTTELKNKKLFLIDMIEALFDHICNNKNLSPTAIHLFRRLTIPVIHLCLVDDGFIDNNSHPARLFLEDFADAALGISDDQDSQNNPLYLKLNKIIELASQEDNINGSFFLELHNDLKRFIQYRKQQANIKSPGSRKQIEKKIDAIILYHTQNHEVPESLLLILNKVWKNVMLNTWFDDNYNDDDWEKSKAFIGTLINSIQPVNSGMEYQRRERLLPVLRQEFEDGLIQINLPFEQKVKLLKYLDILHKKALSAVQDQAKPTQTASAPKSKVEPVEEESDEIEITNELIDEIAARAEQQEAAMANEVNEPDAGQNAEIQLITPDDINTDTPTETPESIRNTEKPTLSDMKISFTDYELIRLATQAYKLPPEPDDQYTKMVKQLEVEDWIEFRFEDRLSRAKITWLSDDKTRFNCLTQNNHVVEMALNVLSHSFRNSIATRIDSHSVITSAIKELTQDIESYGK